MGLFDFLRKRVALVNSGHALIQVECAAAALLDNAIALASPFLADRVEKWDTQNPYLLITLGYISGFLDASYQFTKPQHYDQMYVDKLVVNAIERNLGAIEGSAGYVAASRMIQMLGAEEGQVGGFQHDLLFMRGMMIGGNDFVNFVNDKRPPLALAQILDHGPPT